MPKHQFCIWISITLLKQMVNSTTINDNNNNNKSIEIIAIQSTNKMIQTVFR